MDLRYGINPQQRRPPPHRCSPAGGRSGCCTGSPSYINMLDALNGWQLVREAGRALGRPAAASFKHVSPAGAAVAGPVDEVTAELYGVDRDGVGALTSAYLRARDADPKSSYGDFAAVSHPVDAELAELLTGVVCDGIIAPGYAPGTVATLGRKKNGRFLVMEADAAFTPPPHEAREVFGLRLTQRARRRAAVRRAAGRRRVRRADRGGGERSAAGPGRPALHPVELRVLPARTG